jgi:hypothetical protein
VLPRLGCHCHGISGNELAKALITTQCLCYRKPASRITEWCEKNFSCLGIRHTRTNNNNNDDDDAANENNNNHKNKCNPINTKQIKSKHNRGTQSKTTQDKTTQKQSTTKQRTHQLFAKSDGSALQKPKQQQTQKQNKTITRIKTTN